MDVRNFLMMIILVWMPGAGAEPQASRLFEPAPRDDKGAFRTLQHYSATTTKHINKYLGGKDIGRGLSQVAINEMVAS